MDKPLRVLIVEDSEDDTKLLVRELRRGGYDPTFERVDASEAMDKALEKQHWDIVISDYVMPTFSGLAALELLEAKGIDLPFILVSGKIGEEVAVEALKAGAGGYVSKDNLARVVPTIERELRDAQVRRERKQAEEALRSAYAELEMRVKERTAEIEGANSNLRVEIAERKRAEEERERLLASLQEAATAAERSGAQFEAVFQAICDGIAISDMAGNFILVNKAEARINGFESPEDMMRNLAYFAEVYEIEYPDGKPVPVEEWPISRVLRGESFADWELRGRRKDTGQDWFFGFSGEPVRDEQGQQILAVVVTRDITERRRVEEERERLSELVEIARQRLETVLEAVPVGVVVIEPEGHAVLANRSAEFLFGLPKEQIGAALPTGYSVQHPTGEPYPVEELPLTRALNRGDSLFGVELVVTHPDGRTLRLLANSAPVTNDEGRIVAAAAAFMDVTPLRDLERQREEFISVVAHDLRGALTAVKGFAELLTRPAMKDTLPRTAHRPVEGIISGSRRLERMIADLLDVSRIEARQLTLEKKPVALSSLVREIVQRSEELTKGHPVKVEVRGEIPQVEADPDRIEQVLTNLLSNAGKYSYPGTEITVEVERRANEAIVSVTNLGEGVLPEDKEKLFTRFHRTRQAKKEKVPGLGLGLYIAKGLVEAHGGRIWVESEPGNYATFRFILPVEGPIA